MFNLQLGPTHLSILDGVAPDDRATSGDPTDQERRACVLADYAYGFLNDGVEFALIDNNEIQQLPQYREALLWIGTAEALEMSACLDAFIAWYLGAEHHLRLSQSEIPAWHTPEVQAQFRATIDEIKGRGDAHAERIVALLDPLLRQAEVRFGGDPVPSDRVLGFDQTEYSSWLKGDE